jgi:hypothetical protein
MKCYKVSKDTIIKWQKREDVEDSSHQAHTLHTTLSAAQELIVVEFSRLNPLYERRRTRTDLEGLSPGVQPLHSATGHRTSISH